MEQYTIFDLEHQQKSNDENIRFCEIFKEYKPKNRILLILWWEGGEYPYTLMILNKGNKNRKENFKYFIQQLDRAMEIIKDYGLSIKYLNCRELGKLHKEGIIYDAIVLREYEV